MSKDTIVESFEKYSKIVIEIGSGDGSLLNNLANLYDRNKVFLLGIEIDNTQYINSCNKIKKEEKSKNIQFINESFENILPNLKDNSIDTVISVLPHPTYIDKNNQNIWVPIYKTILDKIKEYGYFILVSELIDELLQPVSTSNYVSWKIWLLETFRMIGFKIFKVIDYGAPLCFSSHYLDKFRNDPERIKIISLIMTKNTNNNINSL
jgi:16S rRNA A1518/A1519 N6-dimethyltransferase RsmA/KsgA/DIM1 with predicted DNA glycosylase/AP lyase activity